MSKIPYYFDEVIATVKTISDAPASTRTELLKLSEKDFDRLKYTIDSTVSYLRRFNDAVKAANIERRNDYPAMIKNASKRFTDLDIAILELLYGNDEGAYYMRGIFSYINEGMTVKYHADAIKKRVKLLKRRGLIEVMNGLFDDDGYVAGSGYAIVDHKRDVVMDIIESYDNKQISLV